jgi:hypothetical protein
MLRQLVRMFEHRSLRQMIPTRFATSAAINIDLLKPFAKHFSKEIGTRRLRSARGDWREEIGTRRLASGETELANGDVDWIRWRMRADIWAPMAKRMGTISRSERCSNTRTNCMGKKSVAPQTERPSRATFRRLWGEAFLCLLLLALAKESKCRPAQGSMKIKNIIPS